jgi:putative flavoprotein involved in K+ transport
MKKKAHTIVVGAGQSGLSVSYLLTKKGIDHLILEKGKVADDIRNRRWDSFRLITPNHMTCLPGFSYSGKNPNGFDSRDEVVGFLEEYAKSFKAPIVENTNVTSVVHDGNGFEITTDSGSYEAKNVVVAVGSFHKALLPSLSKELPKNITQLHSSEYKNANKLPKGSVLIVGGGNSGIQIATDLNKAGRKVYLSVGRLRIVPRKYRGKDFMEWAGLMGALDRTTDEATPEIKATLAPLLFGYDEDVDFRKLAKNGINLTGRLKSHKNGLLTFSSDLSENIKKGETALRGFKDAADKLADQENMKSPRENQEVMSSEMEKMEELDLIEKQITSIIWATGFEDDWSFLKIPVLDKNGQPEHIKGVSKVPRLYFIGLRWLSKYKSFLLCGVGEDAAYITSKIS